MTLRDLTRAVRVMRTVAARRSMTAMRAVLWVLLALLAQGCAAQEPRSSEPEYRALFDGETLDGWEGNSELFRVERGAIVAGTLSEPIPHNEFLCTTESFRDFELRLEVRLLGGEQANAGIQFRTERIPDHHEVIGYQADMGDSWWGALYDESRRNQILAGPDSADVAAILNRDAWSEYVIQADGRRIRLKLNGRETVDYTEADEDISQTGKICLQIHGGPPAEAWYRNIRIQDL